MTSPLRRRFFSAPDAPRRVGRRHAPLVAAELLEARTLLTFYTVSTLADVIAADGKVSLREAIQAANNNAAVNEAAAGQGAGIVDQINFAQDLAGTVVLGGTQLTIADHLRIIGQGANKTIVSGNDLSRVFDIFQGATVEIQSLTVTRGRATSGAGSFGGGGIQTLGTLTVADSILTGNRTVDSFGGGAIFSFRGLRRTEPQSGGTPGRASRRRGSRRCR